MGAEGKTMRDIAASRSEGPNASKIIFEATVEKQEVRTGTIGPPVGAMSMTMRGTYRAVYLQNLHAYRGQAPDKVVVLTGIGLGDCGFDFETGKQYLVYGDRIDRDYLFTSICSGTSPLEEAGPALRFLREEKPTSDDLMDVESYQAKFLPQWTGTACGHIAMLGDRPLDRASVEMTQIRDEPLPPKQFADENGSKEDGSFCIRDISPGKYILTAERADYKAYYRWMGYYPGMRKRSEAIAIEIHAGDSLNDLQFATHREPLYTMRFRIVTADGSPIPLDSLGIAVDAPYQDGLAYHLTQNGNEDGIFYAGYVPPCYCTVQTYVQPDPKTGKLPPELSKWRMVKEEVTIPSKAEVVVLTLTRAN